MPQTNSLDRDVCQTAIFHSLLPPCTNCVLGDARTRINASLLNSTRQLQQRYGRKHKGLHVPVLRREV